MPMHLFHMNLGSLDGRQIVLSHIPPNQVVLCWQKSSMEDLGSGVTIFADDYRDHQVSLSQWLKGSFGNRTI